MSGVKNRVKIRLGHKSIPLDGVKDVRSVGDRIAIITYKNGDTLKVVCGTSHPERSVPSFPGTVDALKALIQRLK